MNEIADLLAHARWRAEWDCPTSATHDRIARRQPAPPRAGRRMKRSRRARRRAGRGRERGEDIDA